MRPLNYINIPSLVACIVFIGVAWFVGRRSPRPNVGVRFVLFCLSYSLYGLSIGILCLVLDKRVACAAAQLASFSGVYSIPLMYDFLLTVAEVPKPALRIYRIASYAVATLLAVIFAFQISTVGLSEYWWGYYATRSEFLPGLISLMTMLMAHAEWTLWRKSSASRSMNERNQLRILFWSTLLTIPSATSNIAFFLYGRGYPFYSLTGVCYVFILGYAVVRYRLLDIDIAIRKAILYGVLSVGLTGAFVGIVLYIQGLLTRQTDMGLVLTAVVYTTLIAAVLQPIRGKIQSAVDRRFFRTSYDLHKSVAEFTESIATELDLHDVLGHMISLVQRTFHASRSGVFLINETEGAFGFAEGVGFGEDSGSLRLPEDSASCRWMNRYREPIVQADVRWDPKMDDPDVQYAILNELRQLDAEILLPIVYKSTLRGLLTLGSKFSEEPYSIEDIRLLSTVAAEAAVAIENSRLVEALKEEDRRKSRFISDMAHELKTPVTSIRMFAQILLDGVADEQKRRQFLRVLVAESDRYVSLVDDFLYITRSESQRLPHRRQSVELEPLLRETLDLFQIQADEKNISLRLNVPRGNGNLKQLESVPADRDRLKQVMINLVNNAIKYTGNGGEVTIEVSLDDDSVITRVRDSGIGIPQEEIDRVFDKYYRSQRARSMVGAGGAGIGLTIAKDIVESHGGTISLDSIPGAGSTFAVSLPTAWQPKAPTNAPGEGERN
ncbi:MAG: hypothetical protein AUJ92_15745 [Armatimonadetes bacterium CG2_30_59_28]|nr:GAF domain-containing protein [Armatimonadota bacterium]OIO91790.1 MAG: hypothetical protein AUJ92_15745 [Armatimonadetes bacterium CG2_30_59_28]PIU66621.1 MAG: hypothetical protein COS85_04020 [Armatimonadetes bacterium CG07_land_8_20_14_0_80_59_28]PIX40072.1 MAG: hypothetical protein COZ56_15655 [Armatimonadetes bacterium CG_4_8_14_3_um_filter_58_9]PIY38234.1 MAG: hypothetical protein COZ05_21090 [Armatimonadetes bacterium CG_4_10_14_3_um_filter_59_10]